MIIAILVLITAGSGVVLTLLFGDFEAPLAITEELRRSYSTLNALQPERKQQLELISGMSRRSPR